MNHAKFERYDSYKDSGVDWMGQVPEHWEEVRIKDIAFLERGKFTHRPRNDPQMYGGIHPFIQTGDVARAIKFVTNYKQTLSDKGVEVSKQFPKGTLLMAIAANIGDVAIVDFDTYFPDSIVGFKPNNSCMNYLFYLFSSTKGELNRVKVTNTQDNLNLERLNSLIKFLPPIKEQPVIATYLDTKAAQIDRKIDLLSRKATHYGKLKQSLINETVTRGLDKTVTMKDSGVEWIGEVPVHWEVKRFKEIFSKTHSGWTPDTTKRESFEGPNIWVTIRDMESSYIYDSLNKLSDHAVNEAGIRITPKGSLLFSFKLSIGKIAFAGCDLYTNEAILSIENENKVNLNYFYYTLPIFLILNAKENIYGAKLLNQGLIFNTPLLYPSKTEQQAIAAYLDSKTAQIDRVIETINMQIEKIKELRKTLINDVVTGKIKVAKEGQTHERITPTG